MPEQRIYGDSDDLLCLEGQIYDEVSCFDKPAIVGLFSPKTGEQVTIFGEYAPGEMDKGVWIIGIAPADEDIPIPDWNIRYTSCSNWYSPVLMMDVPDDVKMTIVYPDNEGE